jgi:mono/diheme cytochrome c family protein
VGTNVETQMRTLAAFSLIIISLQPAAAAEYAALPKGHGREVMVRVCSQCHSPEITASKNMDESGWKALVDQMASNGAQASDAEFDTITKYLAASFPASRSADQLPLSHQDPSAVAAAASRKDSPLAAAPSRATAKAPNVSRPENLAVQRPRFGERRQR